MTGLYFRGKPTKDSQTKVMMEFIKDMVDENNQLVYCWASVYCVCVCAHCVS